MKQTAVEWLVEQLSDEFSNYPDAIIEQAKEIEKEQIIRAFNEGFSTTQWDKITENKSEQYYKQIYNTK